MFKFLSFVSKNLILPIPVMMVLGFGFGFGFGFGLLAPTGWLKLLTFLMVYPMMVTFKLTKVLEGGDSKAQLVAQLINFGRIAGVKSNAGRRMGGSHRGRSFHSVSAPSSIPSEATGRLSLAATRAA